MKSIFTLFLLLASFVPAHGQHLKFMDVELGGNAEFFRYKLIQKGLIAGEGEENEFLFGQYLARYSRFYCREEHGIVNRVFIYYGDKNDYKWLEAERVKDGVVDILHDQLKGTEYYLIKDAATIGSNIGDVFYLKDGYIMVYVDGISSCKVCVVFCDSPANPVFQVNKREKK